MSSDGIEGGQEPAAGAHPGAGAGHAIRVSGVSKHYLMFARPEDRLKQSIMPRLQRLAGREPRRYFKDFAALTNVSFEIGRGETVGIIGRNGSGKSTLLQIICGTLRPTAGTVEVNGRIAALLELGAGFNPEFTGRENVFMNAAILGLSREETEARFEAIARFADIGDFLEHPVKTYSSGMFVRLAFAVAVSVDPDILVVDEALSVGDEAFQRKCFARIEEIKDKGATILFVSHGAQTIVQLCDRAMLIDGGELLLDGRPKLVVNQYQRLLNLSCDEALPVREEIRGMDGSAEAPTPEPPTTAAPAADIAANGHGSAHAAQADTAPPPATVSAQQLEGWYDPGLASKTTVSYEGRHARIRDVGFVTLDGRQVNVLVRGKRYRYQYQVDFLSDAREISFGMLLKTVSGFELAGANNEAQSRRVPTVKAGTTIKVSFEFPCVLLPGSYFTNAGVMGTHGEDRKYLHRLLDAIAFRVVDNEDIIDVGYFRLGCELEWTTDSSAKIPVSPMKAHK